MRIDLIIKDVDVSVAQKIMALLDKDEKVTVEKVVKEVPVTDTAPVSKTERKPYTCAVCGKEYTYSNSYRKHAKHCKTIETKEPVYEELMQPVKAKPKFVRDIKVPKKPVKKERPTYKGISNDHLTDMVISVLTANLNATLTSAQISSSYVSAQNKKFGDTAEVKELKKTLEPRVVTLLEKAAKALGPSQCMSMPIAPNGVQVALFAKSISIKDLKKKLN